MPKASQLLARRSSSARPLEPIEYELPSHPETGFYTATRLHTLAQGYRASGYYPGLGFLRFPRFAATSATSIVKTDTRASNYEERRRTTLVSIGQSVVIPNISRNRRT
jgi:hypothetical protein